MSTKTYLKSWQKSFAVDFVEQKIILFVKGMRFFVVSFENDFSYIRTTMAYHKLYFNFVFFQVT